MAEQIRVVVDAMGGDNAPAAPVAGAVAAVTEAQNVSVILVGKEEQIRQELSKYTYPKERITVVHASEVIETGEPPVKSIQQKKDSSLVVGLKMVRHQEAEALVTSGNTGSVLVGGQTIVRREKGVLRAPIATVIPTEKGVALLADSGANVDCRPEHLLQFAIMGQAYSEKVLRVAKPKVALLNNGAEEEKGNELTKEVYQILKEREDINFIGNIEASDIPKGKADVIVCDGFAGNMVLKMYEGVAATLLKLIKEVFLSSTKTKLGAALLQKSLKTRLKAFDINQYGGAPLLGLTALVVKSHGNAKPVSFKVAILQCVAFHEANLNTLIRTRLENDKKDE